MTAGQQPQVKPVIAGKYFAGSDRLVLTEKSDPDIGGGYYFMEQYKGQEIRQTMWLCQVTEFVFGELPAEIFVKKEKD